MAIPIGANLDFQNAAKPINLPDPVDGDDAATKQYTDAADTALRKRAYAMGLLFGR